MSTMILSMKRFIRDENGATAIEYGLIAALIAVVIIIAVSAAGTQVANTFCAVANSLYSAIGSGTAPTCTMG